MCSSSSPLVTSSTSQMPPTAHTGVVCSSETRKHLLLCLIGYASLKSKAVLGGTTLGPCCVAETLEHLETLGLSSPL